MNNEIWKLYVYFFREIKGYEDWTEEEIDQSKCIDDINEFTKWIQEEMEKYV